MSGNSEKAVEFLKKWEPNGPWVLTSISTDRKSINTTEFTDPKIMLNYVEKYNGNRNIYFSVNGLRSGMESKANKEDVIYARWLHIDIDPEDGQDIDDERRRALDLLTDKMPKGIPDPTVIIFSGGGYQGFWKLRTPVKIDGNVKQAEEFELYNRRLEQVFGGDHCHNVDRIMRLPGTINIPDAKKRKKGRVDTEAKLLQFNNKQYEIDEFKKAQAVQMSGPSREGGSYGGVEVNIPGNVERIMDLSELDEWNVPDRLKIIIAQGHHPDQPKEGDNSRSAWVFDCVCGLIRHGVPDHVIYSLLTDSDWLISSSVIELKGGGDRYARRQIKRAKEYTEEPHLTKMNDRHAVIGNIGGKCRVIEEVTDEVLKRTRITMSSFDEIKNRYSHMQVKIGSSEKGDIMMPLGKFWLQHRMRRQYDQMKFMPQGDRDGIYNLWRGFNFEPKDGDCSLYLEHIRDNICGGNDEHFNYVVKWMATAIQKPANPGQTAIVLRGGKGTGKSIFATVFGRLFGRHFLHVSNPSHLVGNFNAHLRDTLVLFADEAFFAGDKRHESVLKMLVTEDSIPIEAKGYDVETYPNYIHLIMASNDPHVIRASGDERRYMVLEVGEGKKQNKKFFKEMMHQLENGGYEALLMHLQNIEINDFQVRDVPDTDALKEQKLLSMTVDEEWWFRKLHSGRILDGDTEWTRYSQCEHVSQDFVNYADKWKFTRRGNETSLGRFLNRVCPHVERMQRRVTVTEYDPQTGMDKRFTKRPYFYDFGTLDKARDAWEKTYGVVEWSEETQGELIEEGEPF